MEKETLKALKESILKWHNIVYKNGEDYGSDNCALCNLFWDYDCIGCPIKEHTSEPYCSGTPYTKWIGLRRSPFIRGVQDQAHREAANEMLEYLFTLLPKGETVTIDGYEYYWED